MLARDTATDLNHWAREYRAGREVLDFLPALRPAWWVLRAWVAVRLLEVFTTTRSPWQYFSLIPQVGDSSFVGLLALLVAIPASVYAARRTVPAGWRRRVMGAGEGILVLFTVGMVLSALGDQGGYGDTPSQASYIQQSQQGFSTPDGQPLTNLYIYDQSGKLLNGVLVYDQDGRPLNLSTPYSDGPFANDGWLDGNGALVTNIFPRRSLQPQWNSADGQTHYVAVPPPPVTVPQGLHRDTGPGDPAQSPQSPQSPQISQSSQNSPTATPSTPASTPTSTSTLTPGAQTPTTLPTTPTPPAATR